MQTASIQSIAHRLKESQRRQRPRFIFFLGAGASESSGIPVASWMARDFERNLRQIWQSEGEPGGDFHSWLQSKPGWLNNESPYAKFFEAYEPTELGRAQYLSRWMQTASPGWGYFGLSQLLAQSYISTVVTTNFDDLIYESCTLYSVRRPRVYSATTPYTSIEQDDDRPTIVKLHGDYLYANIKNTTKEMQSLDHQLMAQVSGLFQHHEIIVVGYSGSDEGIMTELFSKVPSSNAVYWCIYRDCPVPEKVSRVASEGHLEHWFQVQTEGFDELMDELAHQLKFSIPIITQPIQDLLDAIPGRIEGSNSRYRIRYFEEAIQELRREDQKLASAYDVEVVPPTLYRLRLEAMHARLSRQYNHAIELYRELIEVRNKDTCEVLIEYAVTFELMGRYGDACQWAQRLERVISNPDDLGNYGVLWANLGQYEKGIHYLERAVAKAPGSSQWQVALAMILSEYGEMDQALSHAQQLTEMYPDDSRMWAARSMIHSLRGDYADEAIKFANKAVELNPNGFDENLSLGFALCGCGQFTDAVSTLSQLEIEDDRNIWHRALGYFRILATDPTEAVRSLHEAVEFERPAVRPKTMALYGIALLMNGDHEEANETFGKACLARDNERLYKIDDELALALCGLGVGQAEVAKQTIRIAVSKYSFMKGLLSEFSDLLRIMDQHRIEGSDQCLNMIAKALDTTA